MTSKDAQASAAQNALEYLKIMTKKWASALLLSIVSTNSKTSNTLLSKTHNIITDSKLYGASKVRSTKSQIRFVSNPLKSKDTSSNCAITSTRIRTNGTTDNLKPNISNHSFGNPRGINNNGNPSHDHSKSKDFVPRKFIESAPKIKSQYKEPANQDYKNDYKDQDYKRTSANLTSRFQLSSTNQQHRNDSTAYVINRKTLEQTVPKMASINFPPLRAPQSIVNVRHPFVTESRTKNEAVLNSKSKVGIMQSGLVKDLDPGRQTYGYGTSPITMPSVQNLGNLAPNLSPYPRPDSFPQGVTNVLFPETQFPPSPSFNTTQVGRFPTYDPGNFATTPVNVNPVIPQFSENSIPYPQYENPQFVPSNHYPSAEIANSQYPYPANVSQIQDSPLFIQSLHSPIAVTDQYAAPNYARAVRTEIIPRLRRPPRFSK